ncbi:MAG: hypothetical protein HY520_03060 [Candidatus Aenigmarchaeota archaeon]|nr:hypothetical protein [Candidatus Aenigmarchaeota archaeon]
MPELFKARLRHIGGSVGVLIPKEQLDSLRVKAGDQVDIALLPHIDPAEVRAGFGMARGFKEPFVRDKKVRSFP